MQDEIRIARNVKELLADQRPYNYIRAVIKRVYGIELTPQDVIRYNSMELQAVYPTTSTREPHLALVDKNRHPKKDGHRSFGQEVKSTLRFMGAGALVGAVLSGGLIAYIVADSEKDRKADLQVDQSFIEQPIKEASSLQANILRQIGHSYILDSDGDKKPDAVVREDVLRTAGSLLSLGVDADPMLLIQSLYETEADNFIIKSPDQIIATKGRPAQFTVYSLGINGLGVNTEVTEAWNQINRQILVALGSNASVENKTRAVEQALRYNPEAASVTIKALFGNDIENIAKGPDVGLEAAKYFSELSRDNLSGAINNLATLNIFGSVVHSLVFLGTPYVARATIQGLEGGSATSDQYERMPSGEHRLIFVTDPVAGVTYQFTDPAEAEQKRREIEQRNKR